jgi:hypothetical protein
VRVAGGFFSLPARRRLMSTVYCQIRRMSASSRRAASRVVQRGNEDETVGAGRGPRARHGASDDAERTPAAIVIEAVVSVPEGHDGDLGRSSGATNPGLEVRQLLQIHYLRSPCHPRRLKPRWPRSFPLIQRAATRGARGPRAPPRPIGRGNYPPATAVCPFGRCGHPPWSGTLSLEEFFGKGGTSCDTWLRCFGL